MPILEIESKTKNLKNIKDLLGLNLKLQLEMSAPRLERSSFCATKWNKKAGVEDGKGAQITIIIDINQNQEL